MDLIQEKNILSFYLENFYGKWEGKNERYFSSDENAKIIFRSEQIFDSGNYELFLELNSFENFTNFAFYEFHIFDSEGNLKSVESNFLNQKKLKNQTYLYFFEVEKYDVLKIIVQNVGQGILASGKFFLKKE